MSRDKTKRVSPLLLRKDRESLAALGAIADYHPYMPLYTLSAIQAFHDELLSAQEAEAQAIAAAAAAHDNVVAKEWEFHNRMMGAKDQICAQFGKDSAQFKAVHPKKPSR